MADNIGSGLVSDCLLRLFSAPFLTYSAVQSCTTAKIKTNQTWIDVISYYLPSLINTSNTMDSDYWAAYIGGAKIKTNCLKRQIRTDVVTD